MKTFFEEKKIKCLLESLFKKRELDEWYKKITKNPLSALENFNFSSQQLQKVSICDLGVYTEIDVTLDSFEDENFQYKEKIILNISKILPFYTLKTMCEANYSNFDYTIEGENITGTLKLQELIFDVEEKLSVLNYLKLDDHHLYDKIFDWKELDVDNVETFGAKYLTLEYASFYDVLNLLEE